MKTKQNKQASKVSGSLSLARLLTSKEANQARYALVVPKIMRSSLAATKGIWIGCGGRAEKTTRENNNKPARGWLCSRLVLKREPS